MKHKIINMAKGIAIRTFFVVDEEENELDIYDALFSAEGSKTSIEELLEEKGFESTVWQPFEAWTVLAVGECVTALEADISIEMSDLLGEQS